jgi:hypothetical protein
MKLVAKAERKQMQEENVDKKVTAEGLKAKLKDKKTDWSEYLEPGEAEVENEPRVIGNKGGGKGALESAGYKVSFFGS